MGRALPARRPLRHLLRKCQLPFQGRHAAAAGILPQSARSADSPLYQEGAFGRSRAQPLHARTGVRRKIEGDDLSGICFASATSPFRGGKPLRRGFSPSLRGAQTAPSW